MAIAYNSGISFVPEEYTCWKAGSSPRRTLVTTSLTPESEVTSASTKVIPSVIPTFSMSLSAESWLRTMANTLRPACSAPLTAATPMLPVAPTTRTVCVPMSDLYCPILFFFLNLSLVMLPFSTLLNRTNYLYAKALGSEISVCKQPFLRNDLTKSNRRSPLGQ